MFVLSQSEDDPLAALVRRAAQQMLQTAVEAEVTECLDRARYQRTTAEEAFRGSRNGKGQERQLTVSSGTIKVKLPHVSDRPAGSEPFESQLIKPYQRRSQTLTELFPKLF